MASIICGNCKSTHATVDEVRACYRTSNPVAAARTDAHGFGPSRFHAPGTVITTREWQAPEFPDSRKYNYGGKFVSTKVEVNVPDSRYALDNLPGAGNITTFFEVKTGKANTKWAGFLFVDRLVGGAVGDFVKYPVKGPAKAQVLRLIAADPKAAAKRFADEFSVCARCGRTLTDDTSRAQGLGPECIEKF